MFYALHVSIAYFQFYIISSKFSKAILRKSKSEKADYWSLIGLRTLFRTHYSILRYLRFFFESHFVKLIVDTTLITKVNLFLRALKTVLCHIGQV